MCQVIALRAVQFAGVDSLGSRNALDRAAAALEVDSLTTKASIAERVLGRQLLGRDQDESTRKDLLEISDAMLSWPSRLDAPFFEAYLAELAVTQPGRWLDAPWCKSLVADVRAARQPDGSWHPSKAEAGFGDAYATALCLLILQPPPEICPTAETFPTLAWKVKSAESEAVVLCSIPVHEWDVLFLSPEIIRARDAADSVAFTLNARDSERILLDHAIGPDGQPRSWAQAAATLAAEFDRQNIEIDYFQRFFIYRAPVKPAQPLIDAATFSAAVENFSSKDFGASKLNGTNLHSALLRAWTQGDEAAVEKSMDEIIGPAREALAPLKLEAAEKLVRLLKKPGRHFVVLDAWLALGKDGVLAELERSGLVTERLGERAQPGVE